MTTTSEIKPNLHVWISFGKIFIFLIAYSPFGPLSMVWIIGSLFLMKIHLINNQDFQKKFT